MNELYCPYCKYKETKITENKNKGEFWELSNDVNLIRNISVYKQQEAYVMGCPSCKKIFIFDGWEN